MGQVGQGAVQRAPNFKHQSGRCEYQTSGRAGACFGRILGPLLLFFGIASAYATTLEYQWDAVAGAKSYEYEVYSSAALKENELVRQDRVREPKVEASIPSGYYYLRLRSIDANGVAGTWSQAVRILVKADPPRVHVPKAKEEVEVPKSGHPIYFEWSAVSGATSYDLRLKNKDGRIVSKVVLGTAASIEGLDPGLWSFRVLARVGEQPITQSDEVSFSLKIVQLPRPRFLQPREADLLHAWESIYVRWSRSVPGEMSDIEVMRLDNERGYVFRDRIDGKQQYWLPGLPPGRYQITIRDFIKDNDNESESVNQTIAIMVEQDPTGHHQQYLGLSVRFSPVGVFGGWNAVGNRDFGGNWLNSKITGSFAIRVQAPGLFGSEPKSWGLELDNVADVSSPSIANVSNTLTSSKMRFDVMTRLLGTFAWEPLGASKRILLKAGFFWHLLQQIRDDNNSFATGSASVSARASNLNFFGLSIGGEMRWGGWHPRYDVMTELTFDVPFIGTRSSDGHFGTGGGVGILPRVTAAGYLRRRLGDEWRIYAGPELRFDKTSIGETTGRPAESSSAMVGARLGFEWDL